MEWIQSGGVLIYLIIIMSVVGLTVAIERGIYFATVEKDTFNDIKDEMSEYIEDGDITEAVGLLEDKKDSTSAVLKELIIEWGRKDEVDFILLEEKAREEGLARLPKLERGMWILGIVAHTTPLIGLLGTVTGMIQAFKAISTHGTGDPAILADGISKALITTAGGLIVAIPALILYNYFNKRIDIIVNTMEKASVELINFFRR